jgi:hypothetical protein
MWRLYVHGCSPSLGRSGTVLERIAEQMAGDRSLHQAVDRTVVEEFERDTVAWWADIRGGYRGRS